MCLVYVLSRVRIATYMCDGVDKLLHFQMKLVSLSHLESDFFSMVLVLDQIGRSAYIQSYRAESNL